MKNLSLVFNVVLLIAVIILYYLHFKKPAEQESVMASTPAGTSIVYVNTDSLLDKYIYFKNKKDEFERKNAEIKQELSAASDKLQKEAEQYQQNAAGMTSAERGKTEQGLMEKQQALVKRKDALLGTLDEEQNRFHEELYGKLSSYLKANNKARNYSFVLGYTKGGGILFANDSLDITRQMIEGLNKEFEEKK